MRAFTLALSLALLLMGSIAVAQDGKDQALPHATRGLEAFDAGEYSDALDHFQRAETLFHAPTHLAFMARAHEKLGHLVAARRLFHQLAHEELAADGPPAFLEAKADAVEALAQLDARIPRLEVEVQGPEANQVSLSVDGVAQPEWWKEPLYLDPGAHEISASAEGYVATTADVTLSEGQHQEVALAMVLNRAPRNTLDPEAGTSDASNPSTGTIVPAVIAFGVGGALLAVGAITGGLSFAKVSELEDVCPEKRCDASHEHVADEARTLGTVSTVAFVVGGVGVALGVVLLVWQPGADGVAARIHTRVGLGTLAMEGTF